MTDTNPLTSYLESQAGEAQALLEQLSGSPA